MKSSLIFAGPGIRHGRSEALVYLFDILPTVAEFADASVPADIDGRNLKPLIDGQAENVRSNIFLAYRDAQRAVRQDDWKLIRYPRVGVTQLFNLSEDPHELKNLANDPHHANRVNTLMTTLSKEQQRFGDNAELTAKELEPAGVDEAFFE